MKTFLCLLVLFSLTLLATSTKFGVRDQNGCIPSAGYSWCERIGKCLRPWEVEEIKGTNNLGEAFERFCSPRVGEPDEHGCAGGHLWCSNQGKCLRPWELPEISKKPDLVEAFNLYCEN